MKINGFTLIELLLVVGIMAIIALMSSPLLSNFVATNNLENASFRIISSIRKAQNYSINGKNNTPWGICLNGKNFRIYAGSCIAPTTKEDFAIPDGVSVSGLTDITFSSLRGEPTTTSSITISNSSGTKSININAAGGLTIN